MKLVNLKESQYRRVVLCVVALVLCASLFWLKGELLSLRGSREEHSVTTPEMLSRELAEHDDELHVSTEKGRGEDDAGSVSRSALERGTGQEIRRIADAFALDLQDTRITTEEEFWGQPRRVIRIRSAYVGSLIELVLDAGTLVPLFFSRSPEDVPQGLTRSDAISEENARATMNTLLDELGLDLDIKSHLEFTRVVRIQTKSELYGCTWRGTAPYTSLGIPIVGTGVRLEVSAFSGTVQSFSLWPKGPKGRAFQEGVHGI